MYGTSVATIRLTDKHGNPIQLTDEHNPVVLTDEHGNPMWLTDIETKVGTSLVSLMFVVAAAAAAMTASDVKGS